MNANVFRLKNFAGQSPKPKGVTTMQTYYIFDCTTEEPVGEVLAISTADAEYIAAGLFTNHRTIDMYAIPDSAF